MCSEIGTCTSPKYSKHGDDLDSRISERVSHLFFVDYLYRRPTCSCAAWWSHKS